MADELEQFDDTRFETIVCVYCVDGFESAGQLDASALCGLRVMCPDECEQCGSPLINGETYRAVVAL